MFSCLVQLSVLSWDLATVQFSCGWGVNSVGEAGTIQAKEIITAHISSSSYVSAKRLRNDEIAKRCDYVSDYDCE